MLKYNFFSIIIYLFCCFAKPLQAQTVTTVAGVLEVSGSNDGPWFSARFNNPHGIAIDNFGNTFIADRYNHTIRKLSFDGIVTTIAGQAAISGFIDGNANEALFNEPWALTVDNNGVVYVADTKNNAIRKIDTSGIVTTLAGTGDFGAIDGEALSATFGNPTGIDVTDDGVLYVADHLTHIIRKIENGEVTTLAGTAYIPGIADGDSAQFRRPYGLCLDNEENILVADEWNHKIRKITPEGIVSTLLGSGDIGVVNMPLSNAQFNYPWDIAVDSLGNIFIGDGHNHTIRKFSIDGILTTYAGVPLETGGVDDIASQATFSGATSLAYNKTNHSIYVADAYNHLIRKIEPFNSSLSLVNLSGETDICPEEIIQFEAVPNSFFYYEFYVNDELVQSSSSPIFTPNDWETGLYTISVSTIYDNNYIESNFLDVNVHESPTVSISTTENLSFYEGDSILLVSDFEGQHFWSNGDTLSNIYVNESGNYFVEVSDENACTAASNTISIEVLDLASAPSLNAIGSTTLCEGESVVLLSSFGGENQWYKDGELIENETGVSITTSEAGIYYILLEFPNGDVLGSNQIEVSYFEPPFFDFEADVTTALPNQNITFTPIGDNITQYLWNFGTAATSISANPVQSYSDLGQYDITLSITDGNACNYSLVKENFIEIVASIEKNEDLFIPTAFTPNGDNLNDIFKIRHPNITDFEIQIFNQWGELLHTSNDPQNAWNGMHKGKKAMSATYTYVINIRINNQAAKQLAGHITLLR